MVNLIVESWLTEEIPNSVINIGNNYRVFRLERPTPDGGVLACIDNRLSVDLISNLEAPGKEVLCCS